MPTLEIIFLLLMAAGVAVFGILYVRCRDGGHLALFFKGAATCMAVLTAFLFAFRHPAPAAWLTACGLLLCMAADVLLEIYFLAGVAAFGAAHICFIFSFLNGLRISAVTVLLWLILYGGMFTGFRHLLKKLGKLAIPGLFYAALLCMTCALSLSRFLMLDTPGSACAALGGICFFVSDNILAYCTLSDNRSKKSSALLLTLYYSAVYLLAVSLYV